MKARWGIVLPRFSIIAVPLLLLPLAAWPEVNRTPADSRYFAAIGIGSHLRDGYIEISDEHEEHVAPPSITSLHLSLGKNVKLPGAFRLSLPFFFEIGSVVEDTIDDLSLEDGTTPEIFQYTMLYNGGIQPQIQAPLQLTQKSWAYITLGGGLYYTMVMETERSTDKRHIRILDDFLEKSAGVTAAALGGMGIEWTINRNATFFIAYLFKYWQPVQRKTARDLFPLDAKPYHEQFMTHSFSIGYMFSQRH